MRSSTEAIVKRLTDLGLIEVVERHARAHHVSVAEVCGRARTKAVIAARHGVWAELRRTTSLSYPEIAALFGVDHTSVMHGVRKLALAKTSVLAGAKVRVA